MRTGDVMRNIFMINGHEYYPFAEGKLNGSLFDRARGHFENVGLEVRTTTMKDEWEVDSEIEKHQWADAVFLQSPVNWMGVSWSFKRYMDHVYSAGMDGRLCEGDGRTRKDPTRQYGTGGTLTGKKYMMSLTLNAPAVSFGDPAQTFFEGKSIDDLFWPMHLNFRFFGMDPLPTFSCHDVMKNPEIESDLVRFDGHLAEHFPGG